MAIMTVKETGDFTCEKLLANTPRQLKQAVDAGTATAKQVLEKQATTTFTKNYDADPVRGTTAANMKVKKASQSKDGFAGYVTFNGSRSDGWKGTVRRNAEVAFINEYGATMKKYGGPHPATHWISNGIEAHENEILKAIEDSFDSFWS